ncbi:general glycosylation pathway protein [Thiohalorhabdus methylotrophus]|uniref:General glycosylation pathway protein n=1 Tax=Thiohalorhabdus methylotrophus TaxID=3242694 RepID=A0ABV4TY58_9GAMM
MYALISLFLSLISLLLMAGAIYEVWLSWGDAALFVPSLLDGIALVVIGMAVFDVAKFLVEEEVFLAREQKTPGSQRTTLIKFLVVINIAMLMEALVFVFSAAKKDISLLVYPTFLLIASVLLVISLGIYQKLTQGERS